MAIHVDVGLLYRGLRLSIFLWYMQSDEKRLDQQT
jgi:hypothetical protein